MMDADRIAMAMAEGTAFVCALCKKWHEGRELGLERCTASDGCGSPIVGDTFHEYEGPLTDFLRTCFVCGQQSTKAIRVKGHVRLIGACEQHVGYVASLQPTVRRRLPVIAPTVIGSEGEKEISTPKPERTLSQLLHDIETGAFKAD